MHKIRRVLCVYQNKVRCIFFNILQFFSLERTLLEPSVCIRSLIVNCCHIVLNRKFIHREYIFICRVTVKNIQKHILCWKKCIPSNLWCLLKAKLWLFSSVVIYVYQRVHSNNFSLTVKKVPKKQIFTNLLLR